MSIFGPICRKTINFTIILICGDLVTARGRSSGSSKGSLIQRPFTGGSWPKTMVRSMNSTGRQYPLVPGTIFHRGHEWNTIRDTIAADVFDPDGYSFEVVHKS